MCGRRRDLTATRWLAIPTLTALDSLFFENSSFRASPSTSGSETSPSRNRPAPRGRTPNLPTADWPFGAASAAATLPASRSRPTTALVLVVLVSIRIFVVLASETRWGYRDSIGLAARSLERRRA